MKKQQRYTPEFRAEAVKLITEQGLSQETAAKRLAIPKGTLTNWVAASKAFTGPSAPGSRSAEALANSKGDQAAGGNASRFLFPGRMPKDRKAGLELC